MNKTYRSVWNEALGAWVAISELDGGRRKGARRAQRVRSLDRKDDSSGPVALGGTTRIAGLALAAVLALGAAPEQAVAQWADGGATAVGAGSIAMGPGANAQAQWSTAYGANAQSWGQSSVAIGPSATSVGVSSVALGDTAGARDAYSVAIGYHATTTGSDSLAFGSNAATGGIGAIAIGPNSSASGDNSIAIGRSAIARAQYANAFGIGAAAWGNASTAVGLNSSAVGTSSLALGDSAGARGTNGTAIGSGALSDNNNSVALGTSASSTGEFSVGIGTNSSASATSAIAVGDSSKAQGASTSAFGSNAAAYGDRSTAVGVGTSAVGPSSVAIGDSAGARNSQSIAIGVGATSSADNSVALGTNAASSGQYSVGVGINSQATATSAIAVGDSSKAQAQYASAFGSNAAAYGEKSTAVGVNSSAVGVSSVAIGDSAGARTTNGVAIGVGSLSASDNSMALGTNASSSADSSVALGAGASSSGKWAVGIGAGSVASAEGATAIGASAKAAGAYSNAFGSGASAAAASSVALGDSAQATGSESLAIGHGAQANGTQSISVGTGNVVNGNHSGAFGDPNTVNGNGSYATGNDNTINADNAFVLGNNVTIAAGLDGAVGIGNNSTVAASTVASYNPGSGTLAGTATGSNVVSVGDAGSERRITNVAAGGADTDAVNVSQLKSLASTVTAAGVVQRTGNTDETALTASGGSGATPGAAQKLTNLAAGTLSSTSTDAVNGSQLYTTNQNATTVASNTSTYLGGGADVAAGTAPTYTVQGSNYNNVGSALGAVDGNLTTLNTDVANITNGTVGVVQRTSTADTTVLTAAGGTASNPGNAQKLTNLAAGTLSATSTDAVNGSQLNATNTNVTNLGSSAASVLGGNAAYDPSTGQLTTSNVGGTGQNTVDGAIASVSATAGKGFNLQANGDTATQVKPGDTVQLKDGQNIKVTRSGTDVTIATADDLVATSVTTGNSKLDTNGLAITNGPSVLATGIDAGSMKITNVAAGTLSATSTDAVNGSQLNTTNTNVTNLTNQVSNGTVGPVQQTGTSNQLALVAPGSTGANPGAAQTLTNVAAGALNATSTDAVNGSQLNATNQNVSTVASNTSTYLGGGADVANGVAPSYTVQGSSYNNVGGAIGAVDNSLTTLNNNVTNGTVGVVQRTSTTDETVLTAAGGTASAPGNAQKLTNLAAGTLSATSTDAVNGSQLNATNTNVTNLGSSAASVLGGNAAYDPSTGQLTTSNVGGTGQNTVDGAIASVSATAGKGFNLQANGDTATQVKPGDTVQLKDGQNIKVTRSGTDVTIATADDLVATSVTTGNSKLDTNGLAITNGPSVLATGIDAGSMKITNVAAGTLSATSTDAVNGSQLNATNQNVSTVASNTSTYLGGGADVATGTAPSYTVQGSNYNNVGGAIGAVDSSLTTLNNSVTNGSVGVVQRTSTTDETVLTASGGTASAPGNAQKLTNLAAGTLSATSTDAVNGSQLNATNTNVTNLTNQVSNGTVGPVQQTGTSNQLALVAPGSTGASPGAAQTLTNVAAGALNATSTDAVNGSQLNATNQNVSTVASNTSAYLGGGADVAAGTAPSYTVQGSNYSNVGSALGAVDGNLTTLNTEVNNINNGGGIKYFHTNSTLADSQATGTDSTAIGPNAVASGLVSIAMGDGANATGSNSLALGPLAHATSAYSVAVGASANASAEGSVAMGNNASATGKNDVALGSSSTTSAVTPTTGATINGTAYTFAGTSPTSAVSVGAPGSERQIQNVAAGQLTASSTDAVNGSQLYSTNQAVTSLGQTVSTVASNTSTYLGGGADVAAGTAPSYTVQGSSYNNVGGAIGAVDSSLTTLNNNVTNGSVGVVQRTSNTDETVLTAAGGTASAPGNAQKLTNLAAGTLSATSTDAVNGAQLNAVSTAANAGWNVTAQGANGTNVAPGASVDLKNSDGNVVVSKTTTSNDVTFDLAKNLTADSLTTGNSKLDTNGLAITNGPSVLATGIDAGSMKITNVAAGTLSATSTDAVNGSQLYTTNTNVTNLTNQVSNGTVGPVQQTGTSNQLALVAPGSTGASPGAAQTLTNVAAGALNATSTDAVNGSQLNATNQTVSTVASNTSTYLGGGADVANGVAPSYTVQGSNYNNVGGAIGAVDSSLTTLNSNVTNGTVGVVQRTSTTDETVLTAAGGTASAPGNAQKLTNLAAGTLSATSTDAVNGSQLYTTNQTVSTVASNTSTYLGGGADVANGVAPSYTVQGSSYNNVGGAIGAVDSSLTTLNNNVTNGSVGVVQRSSTSDVTVLTAAGGTASAPGNAQKLTNLAAGTLSATSTDAVNGSQLYATNTAIDNLSTTVASNKTKYYSVNSTATGAGSNADNDGATGSQAIAAGESASASGNQAVAMGTQSAASGASGVALGSEAKASVDGGVALGAGSVSDRTVAGSQGTIAAGSNAVVSYNTTDRTLLGAVSVGSDTSYRQITNVADGTEQQDAVTVRQLTGALQSFAVSPTMYFHANSTATDSAAVGTDSVAIGPQTIVNGDNGIGMGNGATVQASATGGIAIGQASTSGATNAVALGSQASATAAQGVALGASSSVTQAGGVALGAGSVASTASGVAGYIPPTATSEQRTAIGATTSTLAAVSVGDAANGQYRQITGVAAGTVDSDAVNVSQLKAVQGQVTQIDQGTVKYDTKTDGSVDYNSVTMGGSNATGAVTVHNVAEGVAGTDAVNVNQLNAGIDSAKQYADQRVNQLSNDVRKNAKQASAGTASAIAMANLPQAYVPGKSMVSVGAGGFDGEAGLALGVSKLSDNSRWVMKFSATGNSRGKFGVGAGAGFTW